MPFDGDMFWPLCPKVFANGCVFALSVSSMHGTSDPWFLSPIKSKFGSDDDDDDSKCQQLDSALYHRETLTDHRLRISGELLTDL